MHTIRTQHSPDALRFSIDGRVGVLELVINPGFSALVHHRSAADAHGCDGTTHRECEAEACEADDIVTRWRLAGDDEVIAVELVASYAVWQLREHLL